MKKYTIVKCKSCNKKVDSIFRVDDKCVCEECWKIARKYDLVSISGIKQYLEEE